MAYQKKSFFIAVFASLIVLIGIGTTFAFTFTVEGNIKNPATNTDNTTLFPFADTTVAITPGTESTSANTQLFQTNGGNFQGIVVNQKETDINSNTNYLQFYDQVNAWGDLNVIKGIWNITLPDNGLVSFEEQNRNLAKRILGIENAHAAPAINPSTIPPLSARYSTDVNQTQYSTGTRDQKSIPFLQTQGTNIRGLIVNQAEADTRADDHAIDLYDYTNVWGYMNVRDGMWTIAPQKQLITALASDTPAASDVGSGSTNVSFAKFTFSAKKGDITINTITIGDYGTSTSSDLQSLKLIDGSNQIGTTQNLSGGNSSTFSNLNLTIPQDTTKTLLLKATVKACATVGKTIQLGIESSTPAGATPQGTTFTITDSGSCPPVLTISDTGQPTGGTIPKGLIDIPFTETSFSAANGPITVTSISIGDFGTSATSKVVNVKLFEKRAPAFGGDIQLGSTITTLYKNTTTFNGLNWLIPRDTTKTLVIKAELPCIGPVTGQQIKFGAMDSIPFGGTSLGNAFTVGADCPKGTSTSISFDAWISGGGTITK